MSRSAEKQAYRWLMGQLEPAKHWWMLSILLGLGNGLLFIFQASLLAQIIHGVVMENVPRDEMLWPFIYSIIILLLRGLCHWGREFCGFRAGVQVRSLLRSAVLDKLRTLGPLVVASQPAGSWSTLVVEQIEEIHDFIARYLPQMALAVLIPVAILVTAFPINWTAGLIFLLTAPLIPMFMAFVGIKAAEANTRNFKALQRLGGFFLDRLQGMETLRLFQRSRYEHQSLELASENFRVKTMQVLRMAFLSSTILEFFASVSIAVLAVYLGMSFLGYLEFGSYGVKVTLYTGLFLLLLAPEFYQPLRDLGTHYHAKAKAVGAACSIVELLNREVVEVQQGKHLLDMNKDLDMVVKGLTVEASQNKRKLLDDLTFSIGKGERVGIIGPSGAGKSTLMNVLLGFWNYQGSIRVQGLLLSEVQLQSWRRQIAWLGQHPLIIHGTVYDNVSFGRNLTRSQVEAALIKAQALEIVEQLPRGMDSLLTEQGGNLSVGQAQRIALARAIAEPVKLLILDEPTASLDSYNEKLVMDALSAIPDDCTVITVTHRLIQMAAMDRLLMLDNGRLIADGTLTELQQGSEQVQAFVAGLEGSLDNG